MIEGLGMVMPGDNLSLDVKLITPIAMEEKLRFAIREGGRTVGAGVVAKITDDTNHSMLEWPSGDIPTAHLFMAQEAYYCLEHPAKLPGADPDPIE